MAQKLSWWQRQREGLSPMEAEEKFRTLADIYKLPSAEENKRRFEEARAKATGQIAGVEGVESAPPPMPQVDTGREELAKRFKRPIEDIDIPISTLEQTDKLQKSYGGTKMLGELNPVQQSALFKLADDHRNISKTFQDVANGYRRVINSAKDPSPAGDLSMIFAYMKILDPGSAVREQEQADARNAGNIPEHIRGIYNKLLTSQGSLSPNMRQDFLNRATMLYRGAEENQNEIDRQFTDQSVKFGIPPEYVVRDYRIKNAPDVRNPFKEERSGVVDKFLSSRGVSEIDEATKNRIQQAFDAGLSEDEIWRALNEPKP